MKALGLLSLVLALGVAAWLTLKQVQPGSDGKPAAKVAIEKGKRAQGQAQLGSVQSAVRTFQATEGRLPSDLKELESKGYIDRPALGVDYDPQTGAVTLSE